MTWPFGDLTPLAYGAIMADPPWRYMLWSDKGAGKSAARHYDTMNLDELKALPVHMLARGDCLLWLWATAPMLPVAIEVMAAWRFKFITAGAWAKRSRADRAWQFGTGYVLRSAAELFLIGAIGEPRLTSNSVRNLVVAPVREHSRKPDKAYDDLIALTEGQRRCELFARQQRDGFEAWGNEVGKFEAVEACG